MIKQLQAAGGQLAESHPGGIDVLINNAGISGSRTRPIEQCAPYASSRTHTFPMESTADGITAATLLCMQPWDHLNSGTEKCSSCASKDEWTGKVMRWRCHAGMSKTSRT